MTRKLAPAKTANVAIARVLRSLGLKQGHDFRINGKAARGTYVNLISRESHQVTADNARTIVKAASDTGFPFDVDVHTFPTGTICVYISNRAVPVGAETGRVLANGAPTQRVADRRSGCTDTTGQRHASLASEWPEGTRVSGHDSAGVLRTGTVYDGDHGTVLNPAHHNYGRTYVGVTWDELRNGLWNMPRNRPFTDTLTRI